MEQGYGKGIRMKTKGRRVSTNVEDLSRKTFFPRKGEEIMSGPYAGPYKTPTGKTNTVKQVSKKPRTNIIKRGRVTKK